MKLCQEFLFDHLGIPRDLFALGQGYDCTYGNNYCHGELRAGAPFMRPTHSTKLILKSALKDGTFHDSGLVYGYHGTPPDNLKPILTSKLKPSSNGATGPGIYFSPFPLYAQLYSSSGYHDGPYKWQSQDGAQYFVDAMFLVRFPELAEYSGAIDEISATIGAEYCLHDLFASAKMDFENMVIGRIAPEHCDKLSIQGVVLKFHEEDPYGEKGEWEKIRKLTGA